MSLILEALKKSEANRRLGQAPDLGTPFTPARRERSPLWALLVIVASLGAGLWWWFGRAAPAPVSAKPPVSAAPAQNPATPLRHAEQARSAPARKIGPVIQDPMAAGPVSSSRNAKRQAVQVKQEDQRIFGAQRPLAPAPDNAIARRIALSAKHRPREQAPGVARIAPPAPALPTRAPKSADMRGYTPPPQPHPETTPAAAAPPKLDMPTYYDLPFATRKALPQLSLSMHVYTADPKQRFVILDGARMVEGDTTPDSMTLREIRPDGVVLEFQGQRFFFPRDGL
ncbi:MAG TPA: general secretion pathway protein GspB [Rudaea sp.]|nr:general secretion pathway protein GspB [Rudaea sp.]